MYGDWSPGVGVEPYRFDMTVDDILAFANPVEGVMEEYGWKTYRVDESIEVCVESGKIVSIACHDVCYLDGTNCIGLPFTEVLELLGAGVDGPDATYDLSEGAEDVYQLDVFGAQIWVRGGIVRVVYCGPVDDVT